MAKLSIQVGQRVGRGVVIDANVRVTKGKTTRAGARLRCDCGKEYEAWLIALTEYQGKIGTLSCGCLYRESRTASRGGVSGPRLSVQRIKLEVGQRIGRGVVIDPEIRLPVTPGQLRAGYVNGSRGARLQCDCGNTYEARLAELAERNGRINTTSCGCMLREHVARVRKGGSRPGQRQTHGLSQHPLYLTWRQMLRRCENPEAHNYARYGGRGIKVCERWHDVALFIADIEGFLGVRPEGCTLDRIEVDGDYELGNVRWAPPVTQASNCGNSLRVIACRCGFRMRAVYGSLSWWECPQCGAHNLSGRISRHGTHHSLPGQDIT